MLMKLKGALMFSIFMITGIVMRGSVYAECKEGEELTTTTGAIFTCDTSHASLGEAWRDPSGLIWGDIVKKTGGAISYMDHYDATHYCDSIGARLPSKEEFIELREYMGARPRIDEGYRAQVLPNLFPGYWFWSSSTYRGFADMFNGKSGRIQLYARGLNEAVRCVVGR